jgi:hypothetical protein
VGVWLGVWLHTAVQLAASPLMMSSVQALLSLQDAAVGQLPSQVSPDSVTPLPQFEMQSTSVLALQMLGSQH